MNKIFFLFIFLAYASGIAGQDTLYFRLSNPWNTVKDPNGKYTRKCMKESGYYHTWDYNQKNVLIAESFYTDTGFTRKLFCHKYFNEISGFLEQSRCYENGRLHGYTVNYNVSGDTSSYQVFDNSTIVKSWSAEGAANKAVIFDGIESAAEFPGGRAAWLQYLGNNLSYPDSLQVVKGKVLVRFVIGPDGKIVSVEVLQGLHPVLDEEVIRVIRNSPAWKPATQNGRKVKAIITQPVTFG